MRKHLSILLAATLCFCSLGLTACSCSTSGKGASDTAASKAADSTADKFFGTWKMATMKSRDVVMVGDFSQVADIDVNMELTIAEGGSATMSTSNDSADLSWELIDDDTLTLTPVANGQKSESEKEVLGKDGTIELSYQDDALVMQLDNDGTPLEVTFTADGTYPGFAAITAESATPITSSTGLAGYRKLSGVNILGVSMFGDTETLASAFESDNPTDYTLALFEDGSGQLMNQDITWKVTDKGASIVSEGTELPLYERDGSLLVDMSGIVGIDMLMLFSK